MKFISVQRFKGTHTDTSSLGIEAAHPHKLRVVGVLPHGTLISFDKENRAKLRAWLDAQEDT